MNREEILREIDEAMAELREAKRKVNEALSHARNIVARNGDDVAGYNKGLEDAWELARKIRKMPCEVGTDIFGYNYVWEAIENHTPQEALAKLEAYEKNTFKVGDIVQCKIDNSVTIIVTNMCDDKTFNGINANGSTFSGRYCCDWEKTGKHIDFSSILEQIGGMNDD